MNNAIIRIVNGTEEKLINLCPHKVDIVLDGETITVAPSGIIARIQSKEVVVKTILGCIPVYGTEYGEVENLPEKEENTYYIVSRLVLLNSPERDDLLAPGGQVRDADGNVCGCKGLSE